MKLSATKAAESLQSNELEASYVMQVHKQSAVLQYLTPGEKLLDESVWAAHSKDQPKAPLSQLPPHRFTEDIAPLHQTVKPGSPPDNSTPLSSQEEIYATHKGWTAATTGYTRETLLYNFQGLRRAAGFFASLTPFAILVWFILCTAFRIPPIPNAALTSICEIQLLTPTYLCTGKFNSTAGPLTTEPEAVQAQWADFSTLVMVQNAITDTFTGDTPGASDMALQITKAELAISDLIAAIRCSTLRTAEHLADALTSFVQDAVDASDSLQELDAKAMGAVDSILGINTWALRTIAQAESANSGAMSSLAVWRRTRKTTKEVITERFNEAMDAQSAILSHLVIHGKHSETFLKRMKEQLQAIRDLATRENIHLNAERGELLASMWTKVGGHRKDLRRFATNLEVLENLEQYTDEARLHVAQALSNLKTMQSQMKDLRNKVSQPDVAGTTIPADVHIRIIMDGIHRMKEGRIRAREREGDIRIIGA